MLQKNLAKLKGKRFKSWNRTFSEGDFTLMNNLCWTIDWIHTDKEQMKESSPFGERVLPGPCVLAVVAGLMFTTPILQTIADHRVRIVALLTIEDIEFVTPLFPGDSLRAELEIVDAHVTSKANRGILKIKQSASKYTGETIVKATQTYVVEGVG